MAEIKSTMDIIMEKAKNLTMTEEEKKEFAQKEVQGRVRGLFQKYLDGILSIKQFQREMSSFAADQKAFAKGELLTECLDVMTVEGDNQAFFEVMEVVLGRDIKPVQGVIDEFRKKQSEEQAKRTAIGMKALLDQGVSGSAVTPNLGADGTWREYLSDMNEEFRKNLKGVF